MKKNSEFIQDMPLDIAGSSTFGRDPKILASRTFNMILSDDWLVDYAGYEFISTLNPNGVGRGNFASVVANALVTVVYNTVYIITIVGQDAQGNDLFNYQPVGNVTSFYGDVFIDENNVDQIAICDQFYLYIYNISTNKFIKANTPPGVIVGYVTYQDGRFIIPDTSSASWYLSQVGDGTNWFWGPNGEAVSGAIQTKPDFAQATVRFPGHGNLLLVMGKTVTELWTDVGGSQFPYQRSSTINFDYGCLNPATIAISDKVVTWLGANEKSGPVIMYSTGADINQISTDGINYKLALLNHPEKSTGFFLKLAGHLIYQLTFYDPSDNYSVIYDFNTQKFFDVTDEEQNYHIARRVAFFNNDYFFVSLNDGNLYRMRPDLTYYDYGHFQDNSPRTYDIPRIRVCSNVRMPNQFRFVVNNLTFTLEQDEDSFNLMQEFPYQPRIGCSVSRNGGINYSSYVDKAIYTYGHRMNRLNWWQLGSANDFVPQFRFWGKGPWRCTNGLVGIYQ